MKIPKLNRLRVLVCLLPLHSIAWASCNSVEDLSDRLQPLATNLFSATFGMLRVAEPLPEDSAEVAWTLRIVIGTDGATAIIKQVMSLAVLSREMKHLSDRSAIAAHVERLMPLELRELTLRAKDVERSISKLSLPAMLKPAQEVQKTLTSVLETLNSHCRAQ